MPTRFRTALVSALALFSLATSTIALQVPAGAGTKRPESIVSLSPTATEILFAIGAGEQVVAVDDQSDFPKGVPTTDLSGFEPNVEAIAGYQPDLVVVTDSGVADQLGAIDIKALVQSGDDVKRLNDAYVQIRELGKATGHAPAARKLVARIKADIGKLADGVPDRDSAPKVYWELDETYFSADSSTFIGQLLTMAGLENIADEADGAGSGYPQLSSEFVVESDPAVVFLADTECCNQSPQTFAERPGIDEISAVADDHVVPLNDDVASRWGPRVVKLFRQIIRATKKL